MSQGNVSGLLGLVPVPSKTVPFKRRRERWKEDRENGKAGLPTDSKLMRESTLNLTSNQINKKSKQ